MKGPKIENIRDPKWLGKLITWSEWERPNVLVHRLAAVWPVRVKRLVS